MRLSIYTVTIVAATLCTGAVAVPRLPPQKPPNLAFNPPKANRNAKKYFQEAGSVDPLGHYDKRYFNGVVTDDVRTDTQTHMIHAYLEFFRKEDLDTWIAHGTLLGWWWNGKRLPWDVDLDTQVSEATLARLGDQYNQTTYQYKSTDGKVKREYLLDVNGWIWQRERGDGMNVIDARWIDTRNGLFIDITGLSETRPDAYPGVLSCKNYHHYRVTDLYPMRTTTFEGVEAKVPYAYDKILIEEYHEKALTKTEYEGHFWDSDRKLWVKTPWTLEQDEIDSKKRKEAERLKELEQAKMDYWTSWP